MITTFQFIWHHPVSRVNRIAAYSRYFKWQIASRLIQCPIVLPFVENTVLVTESSMTGATGNYYCGLHEFSDMGFILHFLREEDLFLDVGANVGSYTVLASGVVGARTIACEPVPSTFKNLERNIRANSIDNRVKSLRIAIGESKGFIRFSLDRDTVNAVVDGSYKGESELVTTDSLDSLLLEDKPILWKVDVEGHEQAVLSGAQHVLRDSDTVAILLEGQTAEISNVMFDAGFSPVSYDPISRELHILNAKENNYRQNQLWVRDVGFVQQRCRASRIYRIHDIAL